MVVTHLEGATGGNAYKTKADKYYQSEDTSRLCSTQLIPSANQYGVGRMGACAATVARRDTIEAMVSCSYHAT